MPKKPKKKEFFCSQCNRGWFRYDPEGIVTCDSCGKIATQIIRAPTKWKRTPRGTDSMHGGGNFDPSPSYENITRQYEDG